MHSHLPVDLILFWNNGFYYHRIVLYPYLVLRRRQVSEGEVSVLHVLEPWHTFLTLIELNLRIDIL